MLQNRERRARRSLELSSSANLPPTIVARDASTGLEGSPSTPDADQPGYTPTWDELVSEKINWEALKSNMVNKRGDDDNDRPETDPEESIGTGENPGNSVIWTA